MHPSSPELQQCKNDYLSNLRGWASATDLLVDKCSLTPGQPLVAPISLLRAESMFEWVLKLGWVSWLGRKHRIQLQVYSNPHPPSQDWSSPWDAISLPSSAPPCLPPFFLPPKPIAAASSDTHHHLCLSINFLALRCSSSWCCVNAGSMLLKQESDS